MDRQEQEASESDAGASAFAEDAAHLALAAAEAAINAARAALDAARAARSRSPRRIGHLSGREIRAQDPSRMEELYDLLLTKVDDWEEMWYSWTPPADYNDEARRQERARGYYRAREAAHRRREGRAADRAGARGRHEDRASRSSTYPYVHGIGDAPGSST